jgi:exopolyphosphatase / guanosine-5'-triphosphate,3'-diphosphate pyrophosphatase
MGSRVSRDTVDTDGRRRLAVADLGSNTFRLVVFEYRPGGPFRLVDEVREVVRLTEGTAPGAPIAPEAVERAARVARLFAGFCAGSGIDEVRAVATSAIRDAPNGDEVLQAIVDAGLPARVVSGDEEARYGYLGAVNGTTLTDGLIAELGGGSIQVGRVEDRLLTRAMSQPLGAVRMTDAFMAADMQTRDDVRALRRHALDVFRGDPWIGGAPRLVAMGGAVRTLAAMAQKASAYPLGEVHGYLLSRDALGEMIEAMAALPRRERKRIPGLKSDRADIMLAGAVVMDALMQASAVDRMEVCAEGLRWGVFWEAFLAPADPPLVPDVRATSVRDLAGIYGYDRPHCEQVARLALEVFDGLARLGVHDGDPREREWLHAAALLHDVGTLVDYNDHHKHGHYLVLNAGLPGFRHRELVIIAQLVRGHRKSIQSAGALGALLKPRDEERILRLAAFQRIAEQLEVGRSRAITGIDCAREGDLVTLWVRAHGDVDVAMWSARQEAPVFTRATGQRLAVARA